MSADSVSATAWELVVIRKTKGAATLDAAPRREKLDIW
jgi:hypothetical protein